MTDCPERSSSPSRVCAQSGPYAGVFDVAPVLTKVGIATVALAAVLVAHAAGQQGVVVPATEAPPSAQGSTHIQTGGGGDRHNQRIEHIRTEGMAARVDELRVGGETRRITVQPRGGLPAYQVDSAARDHRLHPQNNGATTGPSNWRALEF